METTHRPMTARERSELAALVSPTVALARAGLFVLTVGAVGWPLRGLQAAGSSITFPIWAVVTLLFALLLYRRAGRWTGGAEFRSQIRADLDRGEVEIRRVRVSAAVEAPEVEDEGPVFFIRDEDGSVMFFAGQDMARHKLRGFPWVEFQVMSTPVSNQLFRVRAKSGPFQPVWQRPPMTFSEAKAIGVTEEGFGRLERPWAEFDQMVERE